VADAVIKADQRAHLNRNLRFRPPENVWLISESDFDFLYEFLASIMASATPAASAPRHSPAAWRQGAGADANVKLRGPKGPRR